MNVKVCSYNVRGLGNKNKRDHIFAWLKEKLYSICLLQETNSDDETHNVWEMEWGNDSYFSGTKTNSEGTAILINSNFAYTIQQYKKILVGRIQAIELTVNEKEFVILHIYGHNTDDIFVLKY